MPLAVLGASGELRLQERGACRARFLPDHIRHLHLRLARSGRDLGPLVPTATAITARAKVLNFVGGSSDLVGTTKAIEKGQLRIEAIWAIV